MQIQPGHRPFLRVTFNLASVAALTLLLLYLTLTPDPSSDVTTLAIGDASQRALLSAVYKGVK